MGLDRLPCGDGRRRHRSRPSPGSATPVDAAGFDGSDASEPWVPADEATDGVPVGGLRAVRRCPVPGGEGGTVRVVRCTHADGPFTVEGNFGDPDDVAAILNAYRLAYGGSRGAERRGPEPLSTDLADRTWTASRRGGLAPLIVFAVCGGLMAPMFAYATGPRDQAWFFMTVVLAPIGIILASRLYYVVSPPWLRLDSTGVTIGGARRAWPSPQQVHRWEDCGPFTSVEDSTVQCRLAQGTLTLRAEEFDYRGDLAAELNAYRRVYGSIELS